MLTTPQPSDTNSIEVTFTLPIFGIAENLKAEALAKAKETYVIVLLEAGEITSGKAASILGISRIEMIDRMSQLGISLFDDDMDIESLSAEVMQTNAAKERVSLPSRA